MNQFWSFPLQKTVENTERLVREHIRPQDVSEWFQLYSEHAPTSSNQGTANLPFQRWFHFKEAFSPKFVADTLGSLPYKVDHCTDPFSGSGTTALTCKMLGISSEVIEVNPFLADLADAKLSGAKPASFLKDYEKVLASLDILPEDEALTEGMPLSFAPPGIKGRYIFDKDVYRTARAINRVANNLPTQHGRLLRVLLGSVLVENSNVSINGKGRRYRKNWENRTKNPNDLICSLDHAVDTALSDLTRFSGIPASKSTVHRGDARYALARIKQSDVAIFSPPYPNSFDYTDVYNIELWMLGYLTSAQDNTKLRKNTLRSHVQTKWNASKDQVQSKSLEEVVSALQDARKDLWNRNIPEMIGFYFHDLFTIFHHLHRILKPKHHAIVAIGDSQYAGIHIDVAKILSECISQLGFRLVEQGAIRSMRTSSQHGGEFLLSEHCLVFERL
ncbi:hypothetical protein [Ectopseudomonas toyotomiensis]|uniref:hypothetical protein n=1 Tax=Ectopseudomonas toyotomiensis TaxID=554344 RepID=UPI003D0FD3A4